MKNAHPASIFSLFLAIASIVSLAAASERLVRYNDGAGRQMQYRLLLPDDYDESIRYPLTTYLQDSPRPEMVEAMSSGPYASILVVPLIEQGGITSFDNDRLIREVIDSVEQEFKTDPQRRYLTGFSIGGFGVWHMLRKYPRYFAAGVPIAGFYFPQVDPNQPFPDDPFGELSEDIKHIPVWAFHGANDPVVNVEATRVIADALQAAGAKIRYSELPSGSHAIVDEIYDVGDFPPTVVFRLDVNTKAQSFRVWADVGDSDTVGLHSYSIDLDGADTVQNLAPKSDFSPIAGTSLGFTVGRSGENVFPVAGQQSTTIGSDQIVEGFGITSGILPGAGTGTGEVQANYNAPLLLAAGTYTDLATLDFSDRISSRNFLSANAQVIQAGSGKFEFAVSYTELYHDGQLIDRRGDHVEFYPWLFSQRSVPEPSTGVLCWLGMASVTVLRKPRHLMR
ncbi:MAG: alpha/beta hydrolase-fold protein [Bythopirellula sp.]